MENNVENVCRLFMEGLKQQNGLYKIKVPKVMGDKINRNFDDEGTEENESTVRLLFDVDTSKAYCQMFSVVSFLFELAVTNRSVSLRDVYYTLKHTFQSQNECNSIILEVGKFMQLKRHDMRVLASAKGYVSGRIRFRCREQVSIAKNGMHNNGIALVDVPWHDCDSAGSNHRVLIDHHWVTCAADELDIQVADGCVVPQFLVVIEKEGVFHRLCEDRFTSKVPCVLVTGCGYPDIATRALVRKLVDRFPAIEVVGLCDYNPHGLALLLTYRFPSAASVFDGEGLQVCMRWLGLRQAHIQDLDKRSVDAVSSSPGALAEAGSTTLPVTPHHPINTTSMGSSFAARPLNIALQPLTPHDKAKIRAMTNSSAFCQLLPEKYSYELQVMQQGGNKCELEVMYLFGLNFVSHFLERGLLTKDYL